jgi:hypothetical protein
MALKLPQFARGVPFANKDFTASDTFISWWQRIIDAIISHETTQDLILSRLKRCLSHTHPTTILHVLDAGATCTVTVDAHTRVYGDGTTVAVGASVTTGLAHDTTYAGYYDDLTMASPTPTYVFTTNIQLAQAVTADGRHFLGTILTPSPGTGSTVDGGGVYPVGSNVGGEI